MYLYLVQHAFSKPEEEDPERPLTEAGKKEALRVAMRMLESGLKPDLIFHSPKLRAEQTAGIFASCFRVRSAEIPGLRPKDDPLSMKDFVEGQDKDLMLVGHLPHLSRLASLLLSGKPDMETVAFRNAAAVCLVLEDKWKIRWILPPELA